MSLFDCIVCQGMFPRHECEEVTLSAERYYVCNGCNFAEHEALEVAPPTPPAEIATPRMLRIFDILRRKAA